MLLEGRVLIVGVKHMPKIKIKLTKKRRRVMWWVLAMTVIPVIALSSVFIGMQSYNLNASIKNDMHESLRTAAVALRNNFKLVGKMDSGHSEFSFNENGDFMQGDFNFSQNSFTLDDLCDKAGIYCVVIFDGEVAMTSFDYLNELLKKKDSEELEKYTDFWAETEGKFNDKMEEALLEDLEINGEQYYALAMPIENDASNYGGMIITAKSVTDINPMLENNFRHSLVIGGIATGIIFIIGLFMSFRLMAYMYGVFASEEEVEATARENKAKSSFLAQMSHEIRTPINAVLGMDEMILRENKDPDIHKYASDIMGAGRTLLSLINDILDYSKIEAGSMEIIPVSYELSSVINDSYNMIAMRASAKNLKIIIENDPQMPFKLKGDEVRIRQIYTNILTNAIKYTKEGSVTIKIGYQNMTDNSLDMIFSVIDTGIGIKPEDLEKLFKSFQRVDEENNRKVEGTGLGLSIVKNLTNLMNGEIKVESEYGKGSAFTVILPQEIVDKKPIGKFIINGSASPGEAYDYKESFHAPDARILVVDDSDVNLDVIKGLLKPTKITVDTVSSGMDCLEMAQMVKYDIIFLDHMMPEMDGVETLKRFKQIKDNLNADTPIIALTANAVVGARQEYIDYGFNDYMSKPIQSAGLEKLLIDYLPKEKVLISEEEVLLASEGGNKKKNSFLEKASFLDTNKALEFCGNESLYKSIVDTFIKEDKYEDIKQAFEKDDWENYRILVHGVKSTALYIGAVDVSNDMKALEEASKENRYDYIRDNHESILQSYKALINKLKEIMD